MDSVSAFEAKASEFLHVRDNSDIGTTVVDQWARKLDSGATVIELGCGGGYPITRSLSSAGLKLWAIESSQTLAQEFNKRFPDIPIQCVRAQESNYFNQSYDAAIAVGLLFLLPEHEQLEMIANIAEILHPGGRFLFTAPIEQGNWVDINTGFPCVSLGQTIYQNHLQTVGLNTLATYTDSGGNNYYDTELSSV